MKTVTIPFDLEMAKKIQSGEVEGEIVNEEGLEYEIIKYDAEGDFPLIASFFNEKSNITEVDMFTAQGIYNMEKKSCLDLRLEVPEYLTWKEGDYFTISSGNTKLIFIFKLHKHGNTFPIWYHAMLNVKSKCLHINNECRVLEEDSVTPSTPYEIAKLTDALLKEGKAWNPETKQIEDVKKESKPRHVFKPMDLCLARFNGTEPWCLVQFGYVNNINVMISVGGLAWKTWIPYKGNEHLLGTTNEPEE